MNALENQGFAIEPFWLQKASSIQASGGTLSLRSAAQLPNLAAGLIHGGAGVVDEFGVV